jgi:hypothetical protein
VLQWHFLVFSIFDAVRFCLNEEKILTSAWNFIIFPSVATTFVILSEFYHFYQSSASIIYIKKKKKIPCFLFRNILK